MSGCCPLCDLVFNPDAERENVLAAYGEMTRLGPAATEEHLLARAPRCYLCSVRPVSYDGGLCGNCTDALGKLKDTFAAHLRDQRTEADRPGKMKQVRVPKGTVIHYRLPPEWWEYGHAAFSYRSERAQPPPTWKQRVLRWVRMT